jgi:hypothetical protein
MSKEGSSVAVEQLESNQDGNMGLSIPYVVSTSNNHSGSTLSDIIFVVLYTLGIDPTL